MNEYYDVKSFPVLPAMQHLSVPVPGSKSITNRALLLAAMADGTSVLRGCMSSEDAKVFLECIHTLGFPISETPAAAELGLFSINKDITITGFGGKIPAKKAEIYVGSAGTAARFLVAMLALSDAETSDAAADRCAAGCRGYGCMYGGSRTFPDEDLRAGAGPQDDRSAGRA